MVREKPRFKENNFAKSSFTAATMKITTDKE